MSKLYYTNSEVASLAIQWHNIDFIDNDGKKIDNTLDLQLHLLDKELSKPYKIYIHPDSMDIFQPMVGDLITAQYKLDCGNGDFKYMEYVERLPFAERLQHLEDIKIIQRNGKPFFMPLEEK